VLRVALGVFLIMKSTTKFGWLMDGSPLTARLADWAVRPDVFWLSNWYSEVLVPGAPLFARLVLFGELAGGLALLAGCWTRPVALLATLMILNYHLASGGLVAMDFLSDASGLVVVAALLALAFDGRNLPLSIAG
jgi:uncharacterized membrane protein YphA (DoxX/SURF4 family)